MDLLWQHLRALNESGNKDFEVRAITRDPSSEKAQKIEPIVEEIVKADANDVDSLVKAFEGCYGAFIVSNFWEDMDVKHEITILRNCEEAAKKAGVKHVVFSSLPDTRSFVNEADNRDTWLVLGDEELGMYVPHFDGKAEVDSEYHDELPTTSLYTAFYYENFIYFGMGPSRQSDLDPYAITLPIGDAKLPMVAVSDIGKYVCAIFQDESLIGSTIKIQSEALTGKEIAKTFADIFGQSVQYNSVPWNVYASFGFPGADDLANMFRYNDENEEDYCSGREKNTSLLGDDNIISLKDWVTTNKAAFDLKPVMKSASTPATGDESFCCVIS